MEKEKAEKLKVYKSKAKEKVTGFWEEFSDFAIKGSVIDLAVGIIIGASFNKVVQSLVNDMIMPVFGKVLGNAAFTELYINLSDESFASLADAEAAGAPIVKYGAFITNILDFFIVAFSIFIILKIFFRHKQEKEEKK